LRDAAIDLDLLKSKVAVMRKLGVPYDEAAVEGAAAAARRQGGEVKDRLAKDGVLVSDTSELVALIAYLQRLGVDGRKAAAMPGAAGE
jgi:cytochrome c oxidase cbb3-type subunit I/II